MSLIIEKWFDSDMAPPSGVALQPSVGLIQVQGLAPTIVTLERVITPDVGLTAIGGLAPTIPPPPVVATIFPDIGQVRFGALEPRVDYDPHPYALRMVGQQAQIMAVLAPSVGAVQFLGLSPHALDDRQIGPSTGLAIIAGLAPTLQTDLSITTTLTPDPALLTVAGQIPSLVGTSVSQSRGHRRRGKYRYIEPPEQVQLPITPPNVPEPHWQPAFGQMPRLPADVAPAMDAELKELHRTTALRARRKRDEEALAALLAA